MKKQIMTVLKYVGMLIIIFAISTALRSYVFTVITVSGSSMEPTLQDHNLMILNRLSYRLHDIERFDIVVVQTPENFIIKRVIGLPGDHIAYENSKLYINGEQVDEAYIVDPIEQYTFDFRLEDLQGGYNIIPEGQYLVLGDHRTVSADSREIGLVDANQIIGKTNWVIWPPQDIHVAQ
ncbi:MAG: signal peptidase I [Culicoidibacterales bacterium]